jgi:hypothetical protein
MPRSISQQDSIFDAVDRYFDAERDRIEAEMKETEAKRDLAKLALIWLASGDLQAGAERETAPARSDDVELLTTKELARRISYSTRQIQTFKLEGMPYTGEGRNTRFELSKVIDWLKERTRKNNKNNRASIVGNGRIAKAPIKTRLRAAKRI